MSGTRVFSLVAAPYTPFDADGDLALERVPELAADLRASGVSGVFVAGSTGEGSSLTGAERRALLERWVEAGSGLRVLAHVGHASPREARELAAHAANLGVDGIALAPPAWYPIGSVEALVAVLAEVASGAPDTPLFYYHIPALSGVGLPMARLATLARRRVPSFAGIKYTHLDPVDFQACVREHGEDLELLWGCDELLLAGLDLGARGAVGSTYNFSAPLYHDLIAAHAAGEHERARELQSRSALLVEVLARRGYMASSKHLMALRGLDCGPVRPPLVPLDGRGARELEDELRRHGFLAAC